MARAFGWKRLVCRLILGLGRLLASAVIAAGVLLLLVATGARRGAVARLPLRALDDAIAGRIDFEGARVAPDGAVDLRGVRLWDASGRLLVSVGRLQAKVDVLDLLRRRVSLRRARLEGVVVRLRTGGPQGVDVAAAFQPRYRSPAPGDPPPAWSVHIDDLIAWIDRFDLTLNPSGRSPFLTAAGGRLSGRLELDRGRLAIDARYRGGRSELPLSSPIAAAAHIESGPTAFELQGELALGPSRADLGIGWRIADPTIELTLKRAHVDARLLGQLAPGLGLRSLDLRGTARTRGCGAGDCWRASLETASGRASLLAELETPAMSGRATVRLSGFDPSSLSRRLPPGSVDALVHASGSAGTRAGRRLSARIDLRSALFAGARFGPGDACIRLDPDALRLEALSLQVPGASIQASGRLGPFSLSGAAHVAAPRLDLFGALVSRLTHAKLPRVAGDATVDVIAAGDPAHPAVHAHLSSKDVRASSSGARGVSLDLWTPRLGRWPDVFGRADVAELDAAGRRFTGMGASGTWRDRELTLATVARVGKRPVALSGGFRVDSDLGGGELLALDLRAARLRFRAVRPARIDWRNGAAVTGLELASRRSKLSLAGAWPARGVPYFHVKLTRFSLGDLPPPLWPGGRPAGRLDAEVALQEQGGHRLASLSLSLRRADLPRLPGRYDLRAVLTYAAGRLVGHASVDAGARALLRTRLSARLPRGRIDRVRDPKELAALLLGAPARFEGRLASLNLSAIERTLNVPVRARGTLTADWRLTGSARHPRGEVHLSSTATAVEGRELGDVAASLRAGDTQTQAEARISRPGQSALLAAALSAARPPETFFRAGAWRSTPVDGRATVADLPLDAVLAGRAALLAGTLRGEATLSGTAAAPRLEGQLAIGRLALNGQLLGRLLASLTWDGVRARVTGDLEQPLGGRLAARLALPLQASAAGRPSIALGSKLEGVLRAGHMDLSFLSALDPTVRSVEGDLDADLQVTGTAAAPEATGDLTLTRGRLSLRGLGSFDDIALRLAARGRSAEITGLTARSGIGTLTGRGRADWPAGGSAPHLDLALETKDFALWTEDQLRAILDARLALSAAFGLRGGDLTIRASGARVRLPDQGGRELEPLALAPGIEIRGLGRPAPGHPYPLTVHLVTLSPAEVIGSDLQVPARADVVAHLAEDVRLTGHIDVDRGTMSVFGRRLDIQRAELDYGPASASGRPPDDPLLSGLAEQKTSTATVYVAAAGTLRQPQLDLRSDPPRSRAQIATLLATGVNGETSTAASTLAPSTAGGTTLAASAAGAFLAGTLKNAMGGFLPVDVLTLDPNQAEIGKRIGPLYLGAVENFGVTDPRQNQSEIRARYRLGRGLSVSSIIGDAGADSLDLSWEKNW